MANTNGTAPTAEELDLFDLSEWELPRDLTDENLANVALQHRVQAMQADLSARANRDVHNERAAEEMSKVSLSSRRMLALIKAEHPGAMQRAKEIGERQADLVREQRRQGG